MKALALEAPAGNDTPITSLGDLVQPLDCYTATITQNGQTIQVRRVCGDPKCTSR